jgi:hypothetical protein
MRKCKYIIVAAVSTLVIMLGGQVAHGTGSYDERWRAFMCEIFSPFSTASYLDNSIFTGFYEKSFEAYRAPLMKQFEFKEYYGKGLFPGTAISPNGYEAPGPNTDDLIFAEHMSGKRYVFDEKNMKATVFVDKSYPTHEDIIMSSDQDDVVISPRHRLERVNERSWIVPFSLPVSQKENQRSFRLPDAVSIGLSVDYFRIADDIKMLGGGDLHFPSIIEKGKSGWISPEEGFLRFEWKWGGKIAN